MAVSIDTHFDVLQSWLQEIAKNTAMTRDAVLGRGTGGGGGKSRDESAQQSTFDKWAKRVETAVRDGIGYRLGQAQALAGRGFGGTVEQARMDYALDQLGRQFAAVMSPILNGFTYAASQIETRFRALNGGQQNSVMGGIVGAGLGLRFGGVPGAIAGYGVGTAMTGGGSSTGALMGAAGGAWAGMRAAGPVGALFGGVAGAAAAAPGSYESERPSDYYARMRASGSSRLGAVFSTGAESLSRLFSSGRPGAPPGPGGGGEPRRDVTPFSADPLAAGGTADLIQKALIRTTAGAGFEDAGPLKPVIDIGIRLIEILIAIAGGVGAPVPRSAVGARE